VSIYGADWSQVHEGKVYVFARLSPFPRAYVVYAAEQIPDDAQAISRLLDESFDLRNVALVDTPIDLPAQAALAASHAEIVNYQDTEVIVEASADQPGLLVLGDQYHPGWRAYLDGQPVAVLRVNHVLRGVLLPSGDHQVTFRFAPASLRTGIWLSLAGVLLLIIMVTLAGHPRVKKWLPRAADPEISVSADPAPAEADHSK
jgi:uncharacterized membrane protein YfhO